MQSGNLLARQIPDFALSLCAGRSCTCRHCWPKRLAFTILPQCQGCWEFQDLLWNHPFSTPGSHGIHWLLHSCCPHPQAPGVPVFQTALKSFGLLGWTQGAVGTNCKWLCPCGEDFSQSTGRGRLCRLPKAASLWAKAEEQDLFSGQGVPRRCGMQVAAYK